MPQTYLTTPDFLESPYLFKKKIQPFLPVKWVEQVQEEEMCFQIFFPRGMRRYPFIICFLFYFFFFIRLWAKFLRLYPCISPITLLMQGCIGSGALRAQIFLWSDLNSPLYM